MGADEQQHQDDETGSSQRIIVTSQRFRILDSSDRSARAQRGGKFASPLEVK
jgi:hypothetical protein